MYLYVRDYDGNNEVDSSLEYENGDSVLGLPVLQTDGRIVKLNYCVYS